MATCECLLALCAGSLECSLKVNWHSCVETSENRVFLFWNSFEKLSWNSMLFGVSSFDYGSGNIS